MKRLLLLSFAALSTAAVVAATSAAVPPPSLPVRFGVSRLSPEAGKLFIGLTAVRTSKSFTTFRCDARVGSKTLTGRVRSYYAADGRYAIAVSCGWLIPKGTAGQTLRTDGYQGSAWINGRGIRASWRVRR